MEAKHLTRLLVGALAAVLVVTTLWAGSTSAAAFGVYNPQWDGAADLRDVATESGVETVVVTDVAQYDTHSPEDTVAVVLSPDEPYGPESAQLRQFVRSGGTLIVAEDFGPHSNALLADVGASARFDGRLLRDERRYARNPNFTVAPRVRDESLVASVERITLNHGTSVSGNNTTVLINSSSYSYLDSNRNADLDDTETMHERPVATVERVGEGRVVTVGDPSLFINAMLQRSDNSAFVMSLLDGHATLLLDYTQTERIPPLAAASLVLRGSPLLQFLLGTGGILAIVVGGTRLERYLERGDEHLGGTPKVERLESSLADRYTNWDRSRLSRRMTGLMRSEDKGSEDD